ncbi:MAG: hypothetical protein J5994_10780 [Ruminococcus sp.]|nr:hypothetical protein [Ruminococcus sp.]
MKIPAILSVMKKKKSLGICRIGTEEQYVTDGQAAYNISCLPFVSPEQLLSMMGIPEGKMSDYYIEFKPDLEKIITGGFSNGYTDQMIERSKICIMYMGGIYEPLEFSCGTVFVDCKFLKPFDGMEYDLYERHSETDNTSIIAVKAGFLLLGLIIPTNISSEDLCKSLMVITNSIKKECNYDQKFEQQSFDSD